MKKMRRTAALIITFCTLLALFSGCTTSGTCSFPADDNIVQSKEKQTVGLMEISGYSDIFDLISSIRNDDSKSASWSENADTAAPADFAENDGGADYSGTNVQTEGVDEGDAVKTDGEYI